MCYEELMNNEEQLRAEEIRHQKKMRKKNFQKSLREIDCLRESVNLILQEEI